MSYLDELRELIITFPRWDDYGIQPPNGRFLTSKQIATEEFESAEDVSQLALCLDGSRIVRKATDILGNQTVVRRNSHTLLLVQDAGRSAQRADTSAFLEDFIEWMDEMDARGEVPQFGDDPLSQTIDIDGGAPVAPWNKGQAMIYAVRIHINYTKNYESED